MKKLQVLIVLSTILIFQMGSLTIASAAPAQETQTITKLERLNTTDLAFVDSTIQDYLFNLAGPGISSVVSNFSNVLPFDTNPSLNATMPNFIDEQNNIEVSQFNFRLNNDLCPVDTPVTVNISNASLYLQSMSPISTLTTGHGSILLNQSDLGSPTINALTPETQAVGHSQNFDADTFQTTSGELKNYTFVYLVSAVSNDGVGTPVQLNYRITPPTITYNYDDELCVEVKDAPIETTLEDATRLNVQETIPETGLTDLNQMLVALGLLQILLGFGLLRSTKINKYKIK